MRIIKATEAIPVEHPIFLIIGQPGICKTSLACSAKDPLLLDFDKGAHRAANRCDTLVIDTWADAGEVTHAGSALDPYATVCVDTVGRCLDVMTADIIRETPKYGPNGNLSQQGWGVLKGRFRTWMATLRALGKDVLLVAHDKEDKDGDVRVVRADITGGSYSEVMKVADFVGYCYMSGRTRVLDFNPTERYVGKNPAGWAPFVIPPVEKAAAFMADLFDQGRAALGQISEGSASITRQVDAWRTTLETVNTPAECTAAIERAKQLGPTVAPQAKKLLMNRAKKLGYAFDPKLGAFVEKVQPVAVAG